MDPRRIIVPKLDEVRVVVVVPAGYSSGGVRNGSGCMSVPGDVLLCMAGIRLRIIRRLSRLW
ncbi:hypothetical protein OUZ56_029813 [Daphnia magna]|uniref:Uncharacterized protein n=1 Tax=Daphnia magna TaxID=35525 RepID=A0ABR0B7X0_9CRUS|nr:hypothetical protein OUZ56_029813 [Daphnia magna]